MRIISCEFSLNYFYKIQKKYIQKRKSIREKLVLCFSKVCYDRKSQEMWETNADKWKKIVSSVF